MSSSLFLCFGKGCHHKCRPRPFAALQTHQNDVQIDHKAIKVSKYLQKSTRFDETIDTVTGGLCLLLKTITDDASKIIKQVQDARDEVVSKIKHQMDLYYTSQKSSFNYKQLMLELKQNDYSKLTCHDLKEIIKIVEVIKKQGFVQEQLHKNEVRQRQFKLRFTSKLEQIFDKSFSNPNHKNTNIFEINESSIQPQDSRFISKTEEQILFNMNSENSSSNVYQRSFKKKVYNEKSVQIKQEDFDDSVNIYNQVDAPPPKKVYRRVDVKPTVEVSKKSYNDDNKSQDSLQSSVSLKTINKKNKSQYSKSSLSMNFLGSGEDNMYDSSSWTDLSGEGSQGVQMEEDDEDKLNQTLADIQTQILSKEQYPEQQEDNAFLTIEQIVKKQSQITYFSTKVKIIKLIYYSVLEGHIPKLKFVAGDSTGYAIFFTNFCPGMTVNACLSLINCSFHYYQNDKNFRILPYEPPNMKVNMNGVRLNKVLTSDLYYPLPDKRCNLIRHVAQYINKQRKIAFVNRMYVKVLVVLYTVKDRVFCQVGDSSGRMLAYLKQSHRMPRIQEGDVVRLLQVKGIRGKGKSKEGIEDEQLLYIDAQDERSKVLPHRFDFLDVSDNVMSIQ